MARICKEVGVNYGTHVAWLRNNQEYLAKYARAKEDQADFLAEEIIEIADDGSGDTYIDEKGKVMADMEFAARSRLRVDARKWIASKLKPKKYGDKIDHTSGGNVIQAPIITLQKPNGSD